MLDFHWESTPQPSPSKNAQPFCECFREVEFTLLYVLEKRNMQARQSADFYRSQCRCGGARERLGGVGTQPFL